MFRKTKEVAVKLKITPERLHYLLTEQVRGTFTISATGPLEIESIHCFLVAYERTFEIKNNQNNENRKKFYEHGPTVVYKADKKSIFLLPQNTEKTFSFAINPIHRNVTGSCLLENKIGVIWQVVVDINLKKGEATFSTNHEIHIHMGHQVYIQNAPPCSVVSFQKFLTHTPIEYRVLLHKTTFISSELVSMSLDIKNTTRMDLISMKAELIQTWSSQLSKFNESIKLLKFDINSPPLFPIPAKSQRQKEIQFRLPERLTPSVVNVNKNDTPVLVTYNLQLEFLTNKSDKHTVVVPILIEDNYPAREAIPPPVIPQPIPPPQMAPIPQPAFLPQDPANIQPQYITMPPLQTPSIAGSCYYQYVNPNQQSMNSFAQPPLYPQIPVASNYQTPTLDSDSLTNTSNPSLYPVENNNNNNVVNNQYVCPSIPGNGFTSSNNSQINIDKDPLLDQELNNVNIQNVINLAEQSSTRFFQQQQQQQQQHDSVFTDYNQSNNFDHLNIPVYQIPNENTSHLTQYYQPYNFFNSENVPVADFQFVQQIPNEQPPAYNPDAL